nr:hypothetical protein Iba_chr05cCG6990 [Ipomoea batatas]
MEKDARAVMMAKYGDVEGRCRGIAGDKEEEVRAASTKLQTGDRREKKGKPESCIKIGLDALGFSFNSSAAIIPLLPPLQAVADRTPPPSPFFSLGRRRRHSLAARSPVAVRAGRPPAFRRRVFVASAPALSVRVQHSHSFISSGICLSPKEALQRFRVKEAYMFILLSEVLVVVSEEVHVKLHKSSVNMLKLIH